MEEIEYQKIKLHSSTEYAYNKNFFDDRINAIEKIAKENNIEYALEVVESTVKGISTKDYKTLYTLNLVIKKSDLLNVDDLLNREYEYAYEIVVEKIDEEENEDVIKTEYNNEEEVIENRDNIFEKIRQASKIEKFLAGFLTILFLSILVFEIILIIETGYFWEIIIIMLIGIFAYLKMINDVINKKGE